MRDHPARQAHALRTLRLAFAACVLRDNFYPRSSADVAQYHCFAAELLDLQVDVVTGPVVSELYGFDDPSWDGPTITDGDVELAVRESRELLADFPLLVEAHYDSPEFVLGCHAASLNGALAAYRQATGSLPADLATLSAWWGGLNLAGWRNVYTGATLGECPPTAPRAGDYSLERGGPGFRLSLWMATGSGAPTALPLPRG